MTRFREMCVAGGFLVSVLAVYLVEQQLPPCSTSRIIADGTANRTMALLQMKSHRYIAFQAQNVSKGHFCLRHSYDMIQTVLWTKDIMDYSAGYQLILIAFSVPLCALLSDCFSCVCYSITVLLYYFPFP